MCSKNEYEESVKIHAEKHGKMEVALKVPLETQHDLSLFYTPGVAGPCEAIAADPELVRELTIKRNTVAVVTDGSAVLGLGNIGPYAALPVMEGKAVLFKKYGNIDAWPICLDTQDPQEIISIVRAIAPVFGGINLEDIKAPQCFEVEKGLQDLGIPVFHDDQHGTAATVFAALYNACRVQNRKMEDLHVVINGAGAAGIAISELLKSSIKSLIVCDSKGAIFKGREGLNPYKQKLLSYANLENRSGTIHDIIEGADVFVGVSKGNLLTGEDISRMNEGAIVFALSNPIPEIFPDDAYAAGADIVATGRSDFLNQVNNVLIFPGLFRGVLDAGVSGVTQKMIIAAAIGLAETVETPNKQKILPSPLDITIGQKVAEAVRKSL